MVNQYPPQLLPIVQTIEAWVDAKFDSVPIPHPIRDVSLWHLLTVCEDWARMHFNGMVKKSPNEIEQFIDELKYAMKHCTQKVMSEAKLTDSFPLPRKTDPKTYKKSSALIHAGLWHDTMVRVFLSHHASQSTIEINSQGQHWIVYRPEYDVRYSALEMLGHGQEAMFDITALVFGLLRGTDQSPVLNEFFELSTRMRNGHVIYRYEIGGIHHLSHIVPQRSLVIPDSFTFAWGNGLDTQALINSLQIRCAYHILCIDFAATKFRIRGGFESSLVLTLSREELIHDLAYLADLGAERISKFIDFLTLGKSTDSPDLALQPLVQATNGLYMLPCMFIISNDLQRNILSLMTRTQTKDFDRQSNLFEQGMVERLIDASVRWPKFEDNKTFRAGGKKEEIDLLLIDPESKLLLALECAWMLQPGDPREVFNRVSTCAKKVDQIERKRRFLREHLQDILQSLSLDPAEVDQWSVEGFVVIEGFGGQKSRATDLPIVSTRALNIAFAECETLSAVYRWARSLEWLPQPGSHFTSSHEVLETQPVQLQRPGFILTGNGTSYAKHIRETARRA
jgi:hypothetical protein